MSQEDNTGVHISGGTVNVGGDVVGRDKIVTTYGVGAGEIAELARQFAQIYQKIDAQPADPDVDKAELKGTVQKIEEEVKKGEQANPAKVERWLKFLAEMSEDVFQVTVATLANPVAGVAKAVQLIAQKAKGASTG